MDVSLSEAPSRRNISALPGPAGRIRSTIRLMKRPYESYALWQQQFGKTFLVRALNGDVVVTCNTENIRRVLAARHDEISQFAIGTISPLIGENSVILVSGQRHRRARTMLMPPFHGEALRSSIGVMETIADRVVADWKPGDRVTVMDASLDFSLAVIIQVVFGVQDPERVEAFKVAVKRYVRSFKPIFAFTKFFQKRWLPVWNKFLAEKQAFNQLLDEQIARGKADPEGQHGMLSMLLAARDEEGQPLSDDELREQLITMLFAGHETTQIAIAWAMSWLHRTPDSLVRVREEINNSADLQECLKSEYLHGVCQEALRLNPVVSDFLRVMQIPFELEELTLPAGSTVGVLSVNVHYDPDIYPDPQQFEPQRWIDRVYKPYEFLAFGGGVRRCIGATMATMEMKIALVTWLRRFQFELPPDAPEVEPVHRRNLTMAPSSGIPLIVRS